MKEKLAFEACIDEDAFVKGIKFGTVASLITSEGEGNQEIYPDLARQLVERSRPYIHSALKKITQDWGIEFGTTSHPGCGGAGAQAIPAIEVPSITEDIATLDKIPYWGHLPVARAPIALNGRADIQGFMLRPESDHHHGAKGVSITVGGGISYDEKVKATQESGGSFDVSADWVAHALNEGLSREDAIGVLVLELKIAKAIAPNIQNSSDSFRTFDAGRLPEEVVRINHAVASEAVGLLRA